MDCQLALTEWKSFLFFNKSISTESMRQKNKKIGTAAGIRIADKTRMIRSKFYK